MKDDKREGQAPATGGSIPNRILGSLRDALAAASRDATGEITVGVRTEILPKDPPPAAKAASEPQTPAAARRRLRSRSPERSRGAARGQGAHARPL